MLTRDIKADIRAHALEAYPQECCGLIIGGRYERRKNVASKPEAAFRISHQGWAGAYRRGEVQAVVHSHPDGPDCPSAADMAQQQATGLPYVMVATDGVNCGELFAFGDCLPRPPLLGRSFRHGVRDCYDIIRDWYRAERGVVLPNFPRSWGWWKTDADLYCRNFSKAGFRRIGEEEVLPGDVFLAQVGPGAKCPNHGGVMLERGLMLHHISSTKPYDVSRLSAEDPIGKYLPHISHWLRYEGSGG